MLYKLCIIIPCYNEKKKFDFESYAEFLEKHSDILICLVNDGSTDETLTVLNKIHQKSPNNTEVLSYKKNQGKAEAVRAGILHCNLKFEYQLVAYLDADLAVSLEECLAVSKNIQNNITFCFGSRISKLGSHIDRKKSRFLIGRFVATMISEILVLKVYDTQCGCKIFTKELSTQLFSKPFSSKWLFDVELFFRSYESYGKEIAKTKMLEIPLDVWIDRGDSKVSLTYFPQMFLDLYKIRQRYKHTLK